MYQDRNKIISEALEAVECARQGKTHPRLNSIMKNTIDEMERRGPRQIVKGGIMAPHVESEIDYTFAEDYFGPGGAVRSD